MSHSTSIANEIVARADPGVDLRTRDALTGDNGTHLANAGRAAVHSAVWSPYQQSQRAQHVFFKEYALDYVGIPDMI